MGTTWQEMATSERHGTRRCSGTSSVPAMRGSWPLAQDLGTLGRATASSRAPKSSTSPSSTTSCISSRSNATYTAGRGQCCTKASGAPPRRWRSCSPLAVAARGFLRRGPSCCLLSLLLNAVIRSLPKSRPRSWQRSSRPTCRRSPWIGASEKRCWMRGSAFGLPIPRSFGTFSQIEGLAWDGTSPVAAKWCSKPWTKPCASWSTVRGGWTTSPSTVCTAFRSFPLVPTHSGASSVCRAERPTCWRRCDP
mmetsp:Transcript_15174/g.57696  ORF Transcript_15174/g.57696 Transcript_15174/m.57696 type:complete len:250 (-) Transcript_15174:2730-3479(-)